MHENFDFFLPIKSDDKSWNCLTIIFLNGCKNQTVIWIDLQFKIWGGICHLIWLVQKKIKIFMPKFLLKNCLPLHSRQIWKDNFCQFNQAHFLEGLGFIQILAIKAKWQVFVKVFWILGAVCSNKWRTSHIFQGELFFHSCP